MPQIAVVYFSHTDVTGQLARALVTGLQSVKGVDVLEYKIYGHNIVEGRFVDHETLTRLSTYDAIVFGTPTYMGGASAQFKAFADATSELWCDQEWSGKVAAGFTSGSAPNGDQSSTLQYLVTFSSQHGMFWVGLDSAHGYKDHGINRLGCQLGVVALSPDGTVNEVDRDSAQYLGVRVAQHTVQLTHKNSSDCQPPI